MTEDLKQAFPFTASINEPHTVSLPLPADVEVPTPSITSMEPASAEIGDGDFTLVLGGEGFSSYSVINFAGHDEPVTFDEEAGTLSTGVKPSLWTEPVTVQVKVRNGDVESEPVSFEFLSPGAVRVVDEDEDEDDDADKPGRSHAAPKRKRHR